MVSIPSAVHGAVHVSGAAVLDSVVSLPDRSRMAFITTTLSGVAGSSSASYGITVGKASASLTARVATEASSPLQPIS